MNSWMNRLQKVWLAALIAMASGFFGTALALNQAETDALIALVDDRQRNFGDYSSLVSIVQKECPQPKTEEPKKDKDGKPEAAKPVETKEPVETKKPVEAKKTVECKNEKAFTARVYRRDADDKWMILFEAPKQEAGKGYLRIEKNLFLYEPALGKWERQTERASIGGTNSRREDLDESRLMEEYERAFVADEKLGSKTKFRSTHRVKLTAKPNVEVGSPILELWIEESSKNVLKREEYAQSGRLLRTIYYPTWEKKFSKSKGAEVYVPKEIIIFDEVEKGNRTNVLLKEVFLDPLEANMFTKAWLEKQSSHR